jgi:protein HOOK3
LTQLTRDQLTTRTSQETLQNVTDASTPSKLTKDADLALEAAYGKLSGDHEVLKKKHADFITRFEHLQDAHDALIEDNKQQARELEALRGSKDNNQAQYFDNMKNKIQERDEVIANLEQQIETDRVMKGKYERELVVLRPAAERVLELEDAVRELKTQNETLSKKANMVDHFSEKLKQQKFIENDNATLRRRVEVLEANQVDYDKVHDENAKLHTSISEYGKKFETYEKEHVELTGQRKLLEEEVRIRDAEINSLQARQQHDEKFIGELQEQIRTNTSGPPLSPDSPIARPTGLSLEEELEQSEDSGPNYALEISRLRAENQLLKSSTAGTTNATLQIDLEEAERIRKRLEENLRDLTEKHAIGQMQLNAMLSNSSGEKLVQAVDQLINIGPLQILTDDFYRNEAVMTTRRLYLEANQELSSAKSMLAEIQAELSSRDRDLLEARADRKIVLS